MHAASLIIHISVISASPIALRRRGTEFASAHMSQLDVSIVYLQNETHTRLDSFVLGKSQVAATALQFSSSRYDTGGPALANRRRFASVFPGPERRGFLCRTPRGRLKPPGVYPPASARATQAHSRTPTQMYPKAICPKAAPRAQSWYRQCGAHVRSW